MEPCEYVVIQSTVCLYAVHKEHQAGRVLSVHLEDIFNLEDGSIGGVKETAETLFLEGEEAFNLVGPGVPGQICQDVGRPWGTVRKEFQDVLHGMGLDLVAAHG